MNLKLSMPKLDGGSKDMALDPRIAWVVAGLGALLLVTGLGLFALQKLQSSGNEGAFEQARELMEQLQGAVHTYHRMLADPELQAMAVQAVDSPAHMEALRKYITGRPMGVRDVELLPGDPMAFRPDTRGPHGYVLLDMMLSSRGGGVAPVQVLSTPESRELVAVAPVKDGEQVVAHVLVRADAATVLERFSVEEPDAGYIALEQVNGRQPPMSLTTVGDPAKAQGMLTRLRVPGSLLQIVMPQPSTEAVGAGWTVPLAGLGVILLLAGLLLKFSDRLPTLRLGRAKADDEAKAEAGQRLKQDPDEQTIIATPPPDDDLPPGEAKDIADIHFDPEERLRLKRLEAAPVELTPGIFRAYDVRGVVGKTLDAGVAYTLGQAIGSLTVESEASPVMVARDGRHSGPALVEGLVDGLRSAGCDVVDIGAVPTGVLYFAAHELGSGSGVMVTGSHNPPDYNGFKIMVGGDTLHGDDISALYQRIKTGNFRVGRGKLETRDVLRDYRARIRSDIQLERPLRVVVDCGNGIGGVNVADVLSAIGADVLPLFDEVNGDFPNHHPDPSEPDNLEDLIESVRLMDAELGLALDGDADRLGVVTRGGQIIYPDRVMMLLAEDILGRVPGATIIYDVKCTGHLAKAIEDAGGKPLMWKTGHSLIKAKMKTVDAPFAGEMSGHFFFQERWYGFDDGIYSAARLLEILAARPESPSDVLEALPSSVSTPELKIDLEEDGRNHEFIERFREKARFPDAEISTIDGLRADFEDGWGLVRASNTTPVLVLRFDADDEAALRRIQAAFKQQLLALDPELELPF